MKLLALVIAAVSLLAGCGDDTTATPPEKPADGPLVVFERSGGFAPQPYRLEVDREGKATVKTTTAGTKTSTHSFTLSPDDLATLSDALDEAEQADSGPGINVGCADCFEYSVQADGLDFELDSVTYTDNATPVELVTLVAILEELAAR